MAIQWGRIKTAYLKGDCSYADLAKRYKVSERTIRTRASKEGWKKERDNLKSEVGQAIHARAKKARVEQLEKLIEANDLIIDGLLALARTIKGESEDGKYSRLFLDDKGGLKNAESITKAVQTATATQRDLYKLPTLDQDMQKKAEAQRKREAKARLDLDKEKLELTRQQKEQQDAAEHVTWQINLPKELIKEGVELDG